MAPVLLFFLAAAAAAVAAPAAGASPSPSFRTVYAFGDSFTDTGNTHSTTGPYSFGYVSSPPYGATFFHRSTNRYSDGRLVVDFLTQELALPAFLPPYLGGGAGGGAANATATAYGVNFAVAGATAIEHDFFAKNNLTVDITPQSIMTQLGWFEAHIRRGGAKGKEEGIGDALFWVGEIGANDYAYSFMAAATIPPKEIRTMAVDRVTTFIEEKLLGQTLALIQALLGGFELLGQLLEGLPLLGQLGLELNFGTLGAAEEGGQVRGGAGAAAHRLPAAGHDAGPAGGPRQHQLRRLRQPPERLPQPPAARRPRPAPAAPPGRRHRLRRLLRRAPRRDAGPRRLRLRRALPHLLRHRRRRLQLRDLLHLRLAGGHHRLRQPGQVRQLGRRPHDGGHVQGRLRHVLPRRPILPPSVLLPARQETSPQLTFTSHATLLGVARLSSVALVLPVLASR